MKSKSKTPVEAPAAGAANSVQPLSNEAPASPAVSPDAAEQAVAAAPVKTKTKPEGAAQPTAEQAADMGGEVTVYPLRSYDDLGKRRRRGGDGYVVTKRHAHDLVANKLATTENPKG